jgi:phosphoglycerol transferase
MVGALGFLILLAVLLNSESGTSRLKRLSVFNLALILLGTIGGFSSLLSYLATDMLRSYNRVSIYIAFFSILAVAILAERAAERWSTSPIKKVLFSSGLLGVLVLGLLDQHLVSIDYDLLKNAYHKEAGFITKIENTLPAGSSIFQYPYAAFPEHGPMGKLEDYAEFMPYLLSKSLRWSAGAVRGRRGDAWAASIAGMPPDQAVDTLAQAGFAGIYVAREAYSDFGKGFESAIKPILGGPTVTSDWGHAAFYSLIKRGQELRATLGDKEFEHRKTEVLTPMYLGWLDGCYPRESFQNAPRIWCQAKGHFVIDNPSRVTTHLVFEAKLRVAQPPTTVTFKSDILNRTITVANGNRYDLSEGFDVPPGEHMVTVTTDGSGDVDDSRRKLFVAFDDPHFATVVRTGGFAQNP